MGCQCLEKRKKSFDYVKQKAEQYAIMVNEDVAIYRHVKHGIGEIYDFIALSQYDLENTVYIVRVSNLIQ